MSKMDIQAGEQFCLRLLPALKAHEQQAEDPVHFWAGVFAGLSGFAVHTIGTEATKTLLDASALVGLEVAKGKQQ